MKYMVLVLVGGCWLLGAGFWVLAVMSNQTVESYKSYNMQGFIQLVRLEFGNHNNGHHRNAHFYVCVCVIRGVTGKTLWLEFISSVSTSINM